MEISVIIPIYGFNQFREYTISMAMKAFAMQDFRVCDANNNPTDVKNFEVIIVEQGSDPERGFHHSFQPQPWLEHIKLPAQPIFNKSWCMNVGAKAAKSKWLVFLDADLLFGKDFLSRINFFRQKGMPHIRYFTCWQYILAMPGKDEPILRLIDPSICTAGGAFCSQKDFFWNIGGMNENYFGYGGEDNDLWVRANINLGKKNSNNIPSMPYALVHHYHDWAIPSPDRLDILSRTLKYPVQVMDKLVANKSKLGSLEAPTITDMSDLIINNSSDKITHKDNKGLV